MCLSRAEGHNVQMLIKARGHHKVQSFLGNFLSEMFDTDEPGWAPLAVIEILVSIGVFSSILCFI